MKATIRLACALSLAIGTMAVPSCGGQEDAPAITATESALHPPAGQFCTEAANGGCMTTGAAPGILMGIYNCNGVWYNARIMVAQRMVGAGYTERFMAPTSGLGPNDILLNCGDPPFFDAIMNKQGSGSSALLYTRDTLQCAMNRYLDQPTPVLISSAPVTLLGGNLQAYPGDGTNYGTWATWISVPHPDPAHGTCGNMQFAWNI